eukprot:9873060-Alexandrium_andersonii.AAC.1
MCIRDSLREAAAAAPPPPAAAAAAAGAAAAAALGYHAALLRLGARALDAFPGGFGAGLQSPDIAGDANVGKEDLDIGAGDQ